MAYSNKLETGKNLRDALKAAGISTDPKKWLGDAGAFRAAVMEALKR